MKPIATTAGDHITIESVLSSPASVNNQTTINRGASKTALPALPINSQGDAKRNSLPPELVRSNCALAVPGSIPAARLEIKITKTPGGYLGEEFLFRRRKQQRIQQWWRRRKTLKLWHGEYWN